MCCVTQHTFIAFALICQLNVCARTDYIEDTDKQQKVQAVPVCFLAPMPIITTYVFIGYMSNQCMIDIFNYF